VELIDSACLPETPFDNTICSNDQGAEMDELQLIAKAIVDEAKSRTLADGSMLYNALI
jgi:hypothetical protein